MEFKDRVANKPNRVKLTYEDGGASAYATVELADEPIEEGTPLNAINMNKLLNKENNDYIVEQGTSGTWTYRKWASGIAECWGRYTASGINAAKNNYSGYYYSDIIEILLPCDFLSIKDYQVNGGSEDRVNFARVYGDYSSGKKVGFRICGHQSEATSVDISVYVSVKGRWK